MTRLMGLAGQRAMRIDVLNIDALATLVCRLCRLRELSMLPLPQIVLMPNLGISDGQAEQMQNALGAVNRSGVVRVTIGNHFFTAPRLKSKLLQMLLDRVFSDPSVLHCLPSPNDPVAPMANYVTEIAAVGSVEMMVSIGGRDVFEFR
jgi:hypothetical protein